MSETMIDMKFYFKNWEDRSIHLLSINSAFWFRLERRVKCKLVWKMLLALNSEWAQKHLSLSVSNTIFRCLTLKVHFVTFGHVVLSCRTSIWAMCCLYSYQTMSLIQACFALMFTVSNWEINSVSKTRVSFHKLLFNPLRAPPLCLFTGQ